MSQMWGLVGRVGVRTCSSGRTIVPTGFPQLVSELGKLAKLPREKMLGPAGDLFTAMLQQSDDWTGSGVTSSEVVRLFTTCGKLRVLDSQVLDRVTEGLELASFEDLKRIVVSCNRLKYSLKDGTVVARSLILHKAAVTNCDMRTLVAFAQYFARSPAGGPAMPSVVSVLLEGQGKKVEVMKAEPDLMKTRSVVSADDAMKWITALGQIQRTTKQVTLSPEEKEEVKFILTKILAYELRNVPFHGLLKLFFALSDIEVFDDFFVRRRLVPAIASSFKGFYNPSPKDTVLVLTVLSQLPFSNPLTVEVAEIAAGKIDPKHELFAPMQNLIHTLSKLS